jgi:hypothetical protein
MWKKQLYRYSLLVAMAGVAALLVSQDALAQSPRWWHSRPGFSVTLVGANGETLRTFSHRGQTFVLGEPGVRYGIRVSNPTSRRVEAVISVDGRDALTGRVADFVHHRGYVLQPFGSVTVTGFRQSLDQVASFRFTDPGDSYSSRMGTPQNVGVIGVAFFPEKQRAPVAIAQPRKRWTRRHARASAAPPSKTKRAAPAEDRSARPPRSAAEGSSGFEPTPRRRVNNLGTRYGESRFSPVRQVSFMRASPRSPSRIVLLRYDDEDGLEARGIQVHPPRHWRLRPRPVEPQAFPRNARFAPPPP